MEKLEGVFKSVETHDKKYSNTIAQFETVEGRIKEPRWTGALLRHGRR